MPRSVRLAIVASSLLALIGLVSTGILIADVSDHDAAIRWLSRVLAAPEGVLRFLLTPIYLSAALVVRAALRRDERAREIAFHVALFAAVCFGFIALGVSIGASLSGRIHGGEVMTMILFVLGAALAWSLSRPSAKAWFALPPEEPPAA